MYSRSNQPARLALVEWKTQQWEHEFFFNFFDVFRDAPVVDDVQTHE